MSLVRYTDDFLPFASLLSVQIGKSLHWSLCHTVWISLKQAFQNNNHLSILIHPMRSDQQDVNLESVTGSPRSRYWDGCEHAGNLFVSTLVINIWGKTEETRLSRRRHWAAVHSKQYHYSCCENFWARRSFHSCPKFYQAAWALYPCVD